ncbi:uncharacterized protein E0L32_007233 [Thyridium curvatum]|uniref:Uncharacterized protein n=1 Tax=Thyridium curvatum TaxID=1093900 RepID=A0A507B5J1_9PEZI|nr:uncharacterized protein E0L32_007233 [Thyridium curvatum]TPX12118.1 hypothetical protein E0L32_007233 [Thyridium curvatum]
MDTGIAYTSLFGVGLGAAEAQEHIRQEGKKTNPTTKPETPQPWTATRCHRLLRPLLSHVAALRKEVSRKPTDPAPDTSSANLKRANPARDEPPPRKRLRYTYSSRTSRKERHVQVRVITGNPSVSKNRSATGPDLRDTILPTPVVRRVRGQLVSSPIQPSTASTGALPDQGAKRIYSGLSARDAFQAELSQLRKQVSSSKYSLYESIFRALEALLRTTRQQDSAPRSKSLMSMCLRRVPDLITELEQWEQEEAEANGTKSAILSSKVSSEIYEDLESMGAVNGWSHLRNVVRGHGTRIIKDAIAEGLLNFTFCKLLVKLCENSAAYIEAETILEAMANIQYPEPSAAESTFSKAGPMAPLRVFIDYSNSTGRRAALFRTLEQLLTTGLIPATWLITPAFAAIWSIVARALTTSSTSREAISFAATMLSMLTAQNPSIATALTKKDPKLVSRQVLTAALALLTSMVILGQETLVEYPEIRSSHKIQAISKRVLYTIQTSLSDTSTRRREDIKIKRYILHHCLFFMRHPAHISLVTHDDSYSKVIHRCWEEALQEGTAGSRWTQRYDAVIDLVSSIANCCGRASSATSAHTYLAQVCTRLTSIAGLDNHLKQLRADAAFSLADRTGDMRDLAFAEGLETRRTPARSRDDRPPSSRNALFSGYRWEGGLSEWVTATPLVRKTSIVPARALCQLSPSCSSSEHSVAATPRSMQKYETESPSASLQDDNEISDEEDGQISAADNGSDDDDDSSATEDETTQKHQTGSRRHAPVSRPQRQKQTRMGSTRRSGATGLLSLLPDDELGMEQENRYHAAKKPKNQASKGRQKLSSLHAKSRPPLRSLSNLVGGDGQDSDDELGM